ncbi:MAG: DUF3987 domain-containing protein, partial [Planctomycetota bacterium]
YELQRLEYERALAVWKRSKGGQPPRKPEMPTPRRYLVSDITIEAIAPILEANPRGVLVARDELAGWIRAFNAYKARGRGGDAAAWLQLWSARALLVDRKTGDKRTICVPRAAVSVCGTIQPGVLVDVLTSEHFESGLAARLLLARPPELPKRWSERVPSPEALKDYADLISSLLALEHVEADTGPEPMSLPMTPEAKAVWHPWYDEHAQRIATAETDREASALAKVEAYGARFALIFALAENPAATSIGVDAVRRGIALADWFAFEATRVYEFMSETDETRELRRLAEWIARRGGTTSVRDVSRNLRAYPTTVEAEAVLEHLVREGLGVWEHRQPGARGGRPTRVFRLLVTNAAEPTRGPGDADETASPADRCDDSSASALSAHDDRGTGSHESERRPEQPDVAS